MVLFLSSCCLLPLFDELGLRALFFFFFFFFFLRHSTIYYLFDIDHVKFTVRMTRFVNLF